MKVIFVCTGNTCRSPMAAAYLNSLLLPGVSAESRGLAAGGEPASRYSVSAMKNIGIDISSHRSQQFCAADVNADIIICLGTSHLNMLASAGVPRSKLVLLSNGISDPFGGDEDVYCRCRDEIITGINNMVDNGVFTPFKSYIMTYYDVPDAAALEQECFSEPWSEQAFKDSLAAGTVFFAVKHNADFAGYAGISVILDEGYITDVAVKNEFRRKGAASQLIGRIIRLATEKKLSFISLEVRCSNSAAQKLYEKFGFTVAGKRRGFYRAPAEDAYIMTKRFDWNNENSEH